MAFVVISLGPSGRSVQIAVHSRSKIAHHDRMGSRYVRQRLRRLASGALPTEMRWKIPVMESELHRSLDGGRGTARRRRAAASGWEPVTVDA